MAGPKILNADETKPAAKTADEAEEAIVSGTHKFRDGTKVNVVDEDGKSYNVDASEIQQALTSGYRLERPQETAVREYAKSRSGIGGAIEVAGSQFADEFLAGIPELIYEKTGDPFEVAKREALKKEHEAANIAGGVGGFAASFLWGGPLAKGAATAAKPLTRYIGQKLAAKGLEGGAKATARSILARSAEAAAKMGIEGGAFAAPRAITEASLGDIEAAAETMAFGIGLGALLGGVGGAAGEGLSQFKKSIARRATQAEEKLAANAKVRESLASRTSNLNEEIGDLGFDSVGKVLSEPGRGNIGQGQKAQEAADRLGVNLYKGAAIDDPLLRDRGEVIKKNSTVFGQKYAGEVERTYRELNDVFESTIARKDPDALLQTVKSKAEVGELNKARFKGWIEDQVKQFNEKYGSIKAKVGDAPVSEDLALGAWESVRKGKAYDNLVQFGEQKKVDDILDGLLRAKNQEQIDNVITRINGEAEVAFRSGNNPVGQGLKSLRSEVKALRELNVEDYIRKTQGVGADDILAARKSADAEYRQFKNTIKELTGISRLGSAKSASSVLAKIDDAAIEKFSKAAFNPNDAKSMRFMQKNFPDAFEDAKTQYLEQVLASTTANGQYNIPAFLRKVKALPKEAKQFLFNDAQKQILDDVATIWGNLPKNPNPSGTAAATEMLAFNPFSTQSVAANARDMYYYKALHGEATAGALLQVEKQMRNVGKRLDEIPEKLQSGTSRTRPRGGNPRRSAFGETQKRRGLQAFIAGSGLFRDEAPRNRLDSFRKIQKRIDELAFNPGKVPDNIGTQLAALSDHGAPQVSDLVLMNSQRAVDFLFQSMPRSPAAESPFNDREFVPSDAELRAFERKLDAVSDPTIVIDKIADGTLSRDHLEAIQSVYPKFYNTVKLRVLSSVADEPKKFNYQSRLKLSLLFQSDLDPSIANVAKYQAGYMAEEQDRKPSSLEIDTESHKSDVQRLSER